MRFSSVEAKLQGDVLLNNGDLSFECVGEIVRRDMERICKVRVRVNFAESELLFLMIADGCCLNRNGNAN